MLNLFALIQENPAIPPINIPDPKEELSQLKSLSFDELLDKIVSGTVSLVINVALALLIFYVGKYVIKKIHRIIALVLVRRGVDQSLSTFVLSFVRIVLYFILLVTCIGILGIETSSFIALFASAGVAIGMALSGTLQNFAGGVLILLLKPYKIGDYIEAQGYAGTVTEIQIFHTIISTFDNKSIIIPNGGLSTSSINNYSREKYRRVAWTVAISYGDDVDKARTAILDMFANDPAICRPSSNVLSPFDEPMPEYHLEISPTKEEWSKDKQSQNVRRTIEESLPEGITQADLDEENTLPWWKRIFGSKAKVQRRVARWRIRQQQQLATLSRTPDLKSEVLVNELADSSVNLSVRAWVLSKDYWKVYFDYNEKFYKLLPSVADVHFPFPQMDIHINK